MKLYSLSLLATASFLLPIGSAIAFSTQAPIPAKIQTNSIAQTNATPNSSTPPNPSNCQCPPPPPPMGGVQGNPEPPWMKDINPSTEQRERIKAIHEQSRKDTEDFLQQLHKAEDQMHSLLTSDASLDKLRQQHQQIQKLHQQLDDHNFETMLAVRQVLTSEQRQQLDKLMQQRPPQRPMPN